MLLRVVTHINSNQHHRHELTLRTLDSPLVVVAKRGPPHILYYPLSHTPPPLSKALESSLPNDQCPRLSSVCKIVRYGVLGMPFAVRLGRSPHSYRN